MDTLPVHTSLTRKWYVFLIGIIILATLCVSIKNARYVQFSAYDGAHQWLTASSVKYVNNWLSDGIVKDRFLLYEDSRSVEFEQYNRSIYVSYPPGTVLPLYFIAKITGKKTIDVSFVKHFVQWEYFLSIFLLAFFYCLIAVKLSLGNAWEIVTVSVLLSATWAFLPFNFYYLQNVFFSDQAVIILALLFFINELLLITTGQSRARLAYQCMSFIICIAGLLTDYYFIPIVIVAAFLRSRWLFQFELNKFSFAFARRCLAKSLDLLAATILVGFAFVVQLSKVPEGYRMLKAKFSERTATTANQPGLSFGLKQGFLFLAGHFKEAFGTGFTCLLPIVLVVLTWLLSRLKDKKTAILLYLLLLITGSALLHTLLLVNHSVIHEFSMLKYSFVFAQVFFTLWAIIQVYPTTNGKPLFNRKQWLVSSICLAAVLYMFNASFLSAKPFYASRTGVKNIENMALDYFVRDSLSYNDIAFSPDFEIAPNPPFDMSITRKSIYKIGSIEEIANRPLPEKATIQILLKDSTLSSPGWKKLKSLGRLIIPVQHVYLITTSQKELKAAKN